MAAGPPVLGTLDLDSLGYRTGVNVMQATALIAGPAVAALVSLVARRETTSTLIVAGLLSVSSVAAAIVVTALVGPTRSGDHTSFGSTAIVPLLLGGVLAVGLLTTVARIRRRNLPPVSAA